MKRVLIYSAVAALLVAMVVSGCDKAEKEILCDGKTDHHCVTPDGSPGIYECINGDFGDCIPRPPINAPPCAYMIETELTDNMTLVAECTDGEYVQCQIEPFIYRDTPHEGIYCEKYLTTGIFFHGFFRL